MDKLQRKLDDRIETCTKTIQGQCKCGIPVTKVLNSNCTMWRNGDRYHYPYDRSASCIFRCKDCKRPISETFKFK